MIGASECSFDGECVGVRRGILSDRDIRYRETLRCELAVEVEARVQSG